MCFWGLTSLNQIFYCFVKVSDFATQKFVAQFIEEMPKPEVFDQGWKKFPGKTFFGRLRGKINPWWPGEILILIGWGTKKSSRGHLHFYGKIFSGGKKVETNFSSKNK